MSISRELLAKAGLMPKLRLGTKLPQGGVKSNGKFVVTFLEDKIIRKADPSNGKEIEWVRYIFEHNGEKKQYDTKLKDKDGQLSYFVQKLAEFNYGDELALEMKKQGIKNYIDINLIGEGSSVEVEDDDHEEPSEDEVEEKLAEVADELNSDGSPMPTL